MRWNKTADIPRQHYATFSVELLLNEDNDVRRTRVAHVQGGQEETWANWNEDRLSEFLMKHAQAQPIAPVSSIHTETTSLRLSVSDISVEQARDEASRMDRLQAHIGYRLSSHDSSQDSDAELIGWVEIVAFEESSGRIRVLASEHHAMHSSKDLTKMTISFAPPEIGRYQLLGVVRLPDHKLIDAVAGPLLSVAD